MIEISDLPGNLVGRFEGREHGSSVSFFIGTFDAGTGPGLHLHPYDETFIVEAGSATARGRPGSKWTVSSRR